MCLLPVPTALRVNGPTNGLGVDAHPPLLSPSQVSLGPQSQGYRTADLGDSPGWALSLSCFFFFIYYLFFTSILTLFLFDVQCHLL